MRAVELFRIIHRGTTYLLTSAETPQEHNAETYEPAPLSRSQVQVKGELSKASLSVMLAVDHPLAVAVLTSWAETSTTLTLFRKRTSGTSTIWKGRLTASAPEEQSVELTFESVFTSMRRSGARARFLRTCRHALYGRGCTLDPEDFADAATLSGIDGLVATVPEASAQASGYYSGGMMRAPDGTLVYIAAHSGSSLTLNRPSPSLLQALADEGPGVDITIYPGCDHAYVTCDVKFDNDDNYGGFDYIPTKNPMGGSSIV